MKREKNVQEKKEAPSKKRYRKPVLRRIHVTISKVGFTKSHTI